MRTGWCDERAQRGALARAAESAGIAMVTVHGRTREQGYKGERRVRHGRRGEGGGAIPVVANGDIDSPAQGARRCSTQTGADALMIGRAAQGRPWIFREIAHFLATGEALPPPPPREVRRWLVEHLHDHYALYGEDTGVRSARKHIGWARARRCPAARRSATAMNRIDDCAAQVARGRRLVRRARASGIRCCRAATTNDDAADGA